MERKSSKGSDKDLTAEVRKAAYQLFEKRGRKPGNELADWLEAEKIVRKQFSAGTSRRSW